MVTNILFHFISTFGEQKLIDAIERAQIYQKSTKFIPVTNPIIRFLMSTTELRGRKIRSKLGITVSPNDYMYFNLTGAALRLLCDDIKANEGYLVELTRGILSVFEGPAMSCLNELIAAGYYKKQGLSIELHASKDAGKPDIDLSDLKYASDAKLYPDKLLTLRATINECKNELVGCFDGVNNGAIVVFMFTPHKKLIKSSLKMLEKELREHSFRSYRDENLSAIVTHENYKAGDINLVFPHNNLKIYFQANWPMDGPLESLKKSLQKSVKQARNVNKEAVTWVSFYNDASNHGIQMQVMRHVEEIDMEGFISETDFLRGMVAYSVSPSRENNRPSIAYSVDVYGDVPPELGISKEAIQSYFSELFNIKEVLIP